VVQHWHGIPASLDRFEILKEGGVGDVGAKPSQAFFEGALGC